MVNFLWSDVLLAFLDGQIRSFLEGWILIWVQPSRIWIWVQPSWIWILVKPSRIRNPVFQVWNAVTGELCCSYEDGRRVPINIIRNSIIQLSFYLSLSLSFKDFVSLSLFFSRSSG